jgi:hypothetical protein
VITFSCSNSVHSKCENLSTIPEKEFFCLECKQRSSKKRRTSIAESDKTIVSARLRDKQREKEDEYFSRPNGFKNRHDIQIYERSDPLPRILAREYWDLLDSYSLEQFKEFNTRFKFKNRKFIIKYRYENETDSDFRLLKCTSSEYVIFGFVLKKLLKHDNVLDYEQIRFYDQEDNGWILLNDDKKFVCKNEKLFIKLLVLRK